MSDSAVGYFKSAQRVLTRNNIETSELEKEKALLYASAAQGYTQARVLLSNRRFDGKFIPRNFSTAYRLYLTADREEDPRASFMAGSLFSQSLGVDRNCTTATTWFRRVA